MKFIPRFNHDKVGRATQKLEPALFVELPVLPFAHEWRPPRHGRVVVTWSDLANTRITRRERSAPGTGIVTFHVPRILRRNPQRAAAKFFREFRLRVIHKTLVPLFRECRSVHEYDGFAVNHRPMIGRDAGEEVAHGSVEPALAVISREVSV